MNIPIDKNAIIQNSNLPVCNYSNNSQNSSFNNKKISINHAHYIWLGSKPKNEVLRNIFRFCHTNSKKFNITVWSDRPALFLTAVYQSYDSKDIFLSALAKKYSETIEVNHYSQLFSHPSNQNLLDKTKMLYFQGLVLRHMHGCFKNFAAASDILRLFAINLGGIYMDVDIAVKQPITEELLIPKGADWSIMYLATNSVVNFYNNAVMLSKPNGWLPKNTLEFIYQSINDTKGIISYFDENMSDVKLDLTWTNQRWITEYQNLYLNRFTLTMNMSGPFIIPYIIKQWASEKYNIELNINISPKEKSLNDIGIKFLQNIFNNHENKTKYEDTFFSVADLTSNVKMDPANLKIVAAGVVTGTKCFDAASWCIVPQVKSSSDTSVINSAATISTS